MSVSAREFRGLLKEDFAPHLRNLGFTGSGGVYRRVQFAPFVHLVQLFIDKYGGSAWVEVAVHIDGFPDSTQSLVNLDKVDAAACLIRRRLQAPRLFGWKDLVVKTGADPDEARCGISQFVAAMSKDLPRFFQSFENFPGRLFQLSPQDVLNRSKATDFLGDGRHMTAPLLLLLAEIHLHMDDLSGARGLAEAGLQLCQGEAGSHLRRLFSRIIAGDRRFGFTQQDQEEFAIEQQAFLDELNTR